MRKFTHTQRSSAVPVPVPAAADNRHLQCAKKCGNMEKNERQGRNAPAFVAFYGLLNLHFQGRKDYEKVSPLRLE